MLQNNVDNPTDDDTTDLFPFPSSPSSPNTNSTLPGSGRDWLDLLNDANSYLSLHLLFTYTFTLLTLATLLIIIPSLALVLVRQILIGIQQRQLLL